MKRRQPNKTEKLAAVLLMLRRGTGEWLIPSPLRDVGTPEQICRGVVWQHEHPVALGGGGNDPRMLTPMQKADHDEITAKRDIPRIAKVKRLTKKQEEFRHKLLEKCGQETPPERRRSKYKRKIDGTVVERR